MLDQLGRHGGFDLTIARHRRPAHRHPPHGRGRRHRARRGVPRGARRQGRASAASPAGCTRSTRRWSRSPSTCPGRPFVAWDVECPSRCRSATRRSTRSWPSTPCRRSPPAPASRCTSTCGPGRNVHHIIEATFKGLARCLRDAVRVEATGGVPSHQGRAVIAARWSAAAVTARDRRRASSTTASATCARRRRRWQRVGRRRPADRRPALIADADAVVLPGVGAFGACMDALRARRARGRRARRRRARAGRSSASASACRCCSTAARRRPASPGSACSRARCAGSPPGVKRPQMQWNQVAPVDADDPMFAGLGERAVVLLRALAARRARRPGRRSPRRATTAARSTRRSARGNVFAAQFHPEKSAAAGLGLLGQLRGASSVSTP